MKATGMLAHSLVPPVGNRCVHFYFPTGSENNSIIHLCTHTCVSSTTEPVTNTIQCLDKNWNIYMLIKWLQRWLA